MIIIGLGNPDKKYSTTYHNVGFMCVDKIAEKLQIKFIKRECFSKTANLGFGQNKVILAKPQTYMNLSGNAVRELNRKHVIESDYIIVVCDDIDLPLGKIRLRRKGSGGTHNGLKNIVQNIGENFIRIKIGIGRDQSKDLKDFVLSHIEKEVMSSLDNSFTAITNAVCEFIRDKDLDKLERTINSF